VTLQGFRVELAPILEQRQCLAQHTGLHRVVFNHELAHVKAVMDQRGAERTYGIGDDDLTMAPGVVRARPRAALAGHAHGRLPVVHR
jgi:putative transposase